MESGITGIGSKALAGLSSLRRAVLPNGLRAIGQASFFQCTRLSEITIPASVTSISKAAFGECPALRVVHYGGTQTQWRSMYIGGGNDNLTSASIQYNSGETPSSNVSWTLDAQGVMRVSGTGAMPDYGVGNPSPWSARSYDIKRVEVTGFSAIGARAFLGCVNLESVSIESGAVTIKDSAFYGCSSLKQIYLPSSLTAIGSAVFSGCNSLTTVYYGGNISGLEALYKSTGSDNAPFTNAIPYFAIGEIFWTMYFLNGVCVLEINGEGDMPNFSGSALPPWYDIKHAIERVEIRSGVTSVGSMAFYSFGALREVVFPEGIRQIGTWAFVDCSNLASVVLPDSLRDIGTFAFNGAGLRSADIPAAVSSIGSGAFANCASLQQITVSSENAAYCSVDGVLFTKDHTGLVAYPAGKDSRYTVPEGVVSIGGGAFEKSEITSVSLPSTLRTVEASAFSDCDKLVEVSFNGTKDEWNRLVSVKSDNEKLLSLPIRFQDAPLQPVIESVYRNQGFITATIVCPKDHAVLFCGVYNNSGKMVAVRFAQITGESNYQFQFDGQQFDYAKVFIIDSDFRPLCESKRTN